MGVYFTHLISADLPSHCCGESLLWRIITAATNLHVISRNFPVRRMPLSARIVISALRQAETEECQVSWDRAGFVEISAVFCRFLLRGCMYTPVKVRRLVWGHMNFFNVKT